MRTCATTFQLFSFFVTASWCLREEPNPTWQGINGFNWGGGAAHLAWDQGAEICATPMRYEAPGSRILPRPLCQETEVTAEKRAGASNIQVGAPAT